MAESAVIDLRDRKNPPPDDAVNAPYGFRWDTRKKEWVTKRSAGGRKSGAAWFGLGKEEPESTPGEEPVISHDPVDGDYFRGARYEDPEPAHMRSRPPRAPKAPVKITKKAKDDIAASCGMVGMIVLPVVNSRDPYCGGVLTDNFAQITDALVPILCRSQAVVNFFSSDTSDWMLWFKLAMALSPVAVAVGRHHLIRNITIQEDPDTGDLYAVPSDMSMYSTDASDDEDDALEAVQ